MSLQEIREKYLTVSEIAVLTGKPSYRVHNWINRGLLPCEKILSSVAVLRSDFEKFKSERPELLGQEQWKPELKN